LSQPADSTPVAFVDRATAVAGTASAGAGGVDFYYTTTGANEAREADRWIACGTLELPGGDAPQPFSGSCALQEGDSATQVSGIAALAYTCDLLGCEDPLGAKLSESGDAHRVFGFNSEPKISITPTTGTGAANSCQRIAVLATDGAGEPLADISVDLHAKGPSEGIRFCDPDGGSSPRSAPNDGGHSPVSGENDEGVHSNNNTHHTEGTTGSGGRFVVGIKSPSNGTTEIVAWVDETEDDIQGADEGSVETTFSWGTPLACTLIGTKGDDRLVGDSGSDRICGKGGDDVIVGKGGNDILIGGGGNDVLRGGGGNDKLKGSKGGDAMFGSGGNDNLGGAAGNDELNGGPGKDRLRGGSGNDSLNGGGGRDACAAGKGRNKEKKCE
jgi:hypothetical protein